MSALFRDVHKTQYRLVQSFLSRQTRTNATHTEDEQNWVRSPFADVECPTNITLAQYLRKNMGKWRHLPAFECGVTGVCYSHDQIHDMSTSFAKALLSSGFTKGHVIGIALKNVPEYAAILYGILEAELVASTLNPDFTPAELGRQLKMCEATGVITTQNILKTIRSCEATAQCPKLKTIILVGGTHEAGCENFQDLVNIGSKCDEKLSVTCEDTRKDLALLLYSSGTTGLPKGVGLTQYNILSNLIQITHPKLVSGQRFSNGVQERLIGLLPFYHSYGLASFLTAGVHDGAHTLCIPKFDAKTFPEIMKKHKIVGSDEYSADELSSIDHVNVGAAPVGPALLNKLYAKAGRKFVLREGYGLTELSSASHLLPPDLTGRKLGSAGVPVPNTITKIIDPETGKALPRNQHGEICVKGPQLMQGYYKNEAATRNAIDEDGWLHTGDIGYYDDEGFLYIVDRIKELIKVKGFQVSPAELEDVLRLHAGVGDVGVLGIPDPDYGQVPLAYVVRKGEVLTAEEVQEFLMGQLSSYKQLRGGVRFVSAIPNPLRRAQKYVRTKSGVIVII